MEPTNGSVDGEAVDVEQHVADEPASGAGVKTRRRMMKAAGAAAVGGLAWAAAQAGSASASSGGNLILGQENDAGSDKTMLKSSPSVGTPALQIDNTGADSHANLAKDDYAVDAKGPVGGVRAEGPSFGVAGFATALDGFAGVSGNGPVGVSGSSGDPAGHGVAGTNPTGTGMKGIGTQGVHGKTLANDTTEGYGLKGEANTNAGAGILATNKAAAIPPLPSLGEKVALRAHSDDTGVHAEAPKVAVRGKAIDVGGTGIHGIAHTGDDGTGTGVKGEHTKPTGAGVLGTNPAGVGTKGEGKIGLHGKTADAAGLGTFSENTDPAGAGHRGHGGKFGVLGDASSTDGSGIVGFNSATPLPPPGPPAAGRKARQSSMPTPLVVALANGLYTGVTGVGDDIGVLGQSDAGTGVAASTGTGTALQITATDPAGTALEVVGKTCLDTGGESGQTIRPPGLRSFTVPSIAAGAISVKVSDPRVTTKCFINVILTGNPGKSGDELPSVSYVVRAAGSFTIFLTDKVSKKTTFAYYFVELCPPGVP